VSSKGAVDGVAVVRREGRGYRRQRDAGKLGHHEVRGAEGVGLGVVFEDVRDGELCVLMEESEGRVGGFEEVFFVAEEVEGTCGRTFYYEGATICEFREVDLVECSLETFGLSEYDS
jgi:hypothetical protein